MDYVLIWKVVMVVYTRTTKLNVIKSNEKQNFKEDIEWVNKKTKKTIWS
jgi:hypothetical protein